LAAVGFDVAAEAYDRFMGRYSVGLAAPLADLAGVSTGQRALDVGCGPGALTRELASRLGPDAVGAVDPSGSFVDAARERNPGVDVRLAAAEDLPFGDGEFDASLAQLVVHFMADPVAGLREMARVTRAGGAVVACVWDHAGGQGPLGVFWEAVRSLDAHARDESDLAGARAGHLAELFATSGLRVIEETVLAVRVEHASFEEWWEPFTLGVGPAGAYVSGLADGDRDELRERCRARLPSPPFTVTARAWAVRGRP
jgi:SAM-dependent methyltransferase